MWILLAYCLLTPHMRYMSTSVAPSIPPYGVDPVTCHLPHVGQLIRPLILPNCRKADHHCTFNKLTCYIHENLFLSKVFQKIKIVSSYLTTFIFGDYCCPAAGAGSESRCLKRLSTNLTFSYTFPSALQSLHNFTMCNF